MQEEEKVYRELQQHLDSQPVCYPPTETGAEIRILKSLFTPEEARLATHLSYKPRSAEQVYDTAKAGGMSRAEMENMLDGMIKKGVIRFIEREGKRYFCNLPFILGIWEAQAHSLTPEFLEKFEEYISDLAFGATFLTRGFSQMRTIPIEQSLPIDRHVTTYDHLTESINRMDGPFVITECICRKVANMKGKTCQKTSRLEVCMILGDWARHYIEAGFGREISKAEALEIIRQNEADGLVLQPSNTQNLEFVCACCSCCCMMLGAHKMLPRPVDFWISNYHAVIDAGNCSGCGDCVERCQVDALSMDEDADIAAVNLDRCIGCGVCVPACPLDAIHLVKKEKEEVPPVDLVGLYDSIKAKSQGAA